MNQDNVLLKMDNITKIYPNGVIANKNMNFVAKEGEIHALMGENGAGKSTLMKILFGEESLDEGKIYLQGKEVQINTPLDAIGLGIGMVYQHFMLVDELTVLENIILGMEPKKGLFIDKDHARNKVIEFSIKYNLGVNPNQKVKNLSVSQKQKVEILKVLIRGAKILILDEPTAVLTPQETEELFEQILKLKEQNHTIIFISHKLKEIKEICDKITIMRNGYGVGTYDVEDITTEDISRLMIGRDIDSKIVKKIANPKEIILKVEDLRVVKDNIETVKGVNFIVRSGQILGIAAIEGNGQREILDAITGLGNYDSGKITINGHYELKKSDPAERRRLGLTHIPEDRFVYGVMRESSIKENLISNRYNLKEYNKGLFLDQNKINKLVDDLISEYEIKTDSPNTPVKMLSGGNAQKVVAAREMSTNMDVLIADQPTRGIDIGTATFIRNRIIDLRDQGKAILVSSADINEILDISDTLMVLYDGRITGYFSDTDDLDENDIGLYMLGLKTMSPIEIERKIYGRE